MEDANQLELPNSVEEFLVAGNIGIVSGTAEVARSENGTTLEESKTNIPTTQIIHL